MDQINQFTHKKTIEIPRAKLKHVFVYLIDGRYRYATAKSIDKYVIYWTLPQTTYIHKYGWYLGHRYLPYISFFNGTNCNISMPWMIAIFSILDVPLKYRGSSNSTESLNRVTFCTVSIWMNWMDALLRDFLDKPQIFYALEFNLLFAYILSVLPTYRR